ncbi:hypothetical protein ACVWXM_004068 [Bradyrhizobium sp. GM7.3]
MPRENDLEGKPDMGGKHGGQAGQPKSPPRPRQGERDEDVVAKRHTRPNRSQLRADQTKIASRPRCTRTGNGSLVLPLP